MLLAAYRIEFYDLHQFGIIEISYIRIIESNVMIVKDENRVTSTENEEEIYAMNFFKKVDEIQEAVALDTDLKTWANASAWSLEDDTAVEITDVKYDFDPETITPGIYDVTFATKGYEYKIDTTDKFEVGDEVGLTFQPEDIHIMSKNNY